MVSSANYRSEADQWQGEPVIKLYDAASGAQVTIVPGLGANCVAWSVVKNDGQRVAVLETPPSPEELRLWRIKGGIPIMWPFPGRVRDARYRFEGREYHLPHPNSPHHVHGLVLNRPWHLTGHGADEQSAWAACQVTAADLNEEERAGYPFDFALTIRYRLSGQVLDIEAHLTNRGDQTLPFGYGLHPYFHAPLKPAADVSERAACEVILPASTRWPLEQGMPSGAAHPVQPDEDFRQWRPLGPSQYDNVYGDLAFQGEWSEAGYCDREAGLEVLVRADHNFQSWVLFTQPNRPSVCVEPFSRIPNALNLAAEGIQADSLATVAPGATQIIRNQFEVRAFTV